MDVTNNEDITMSELYKHLWDDKSAGETVKSISWNKDLADLVGKRRKCGML